MPQHVGAESGDGDGSPVFVKMMTSKDRWNRAGWCFETLYDKNGRGSVPVLERTSSPLREVGLHVSDLARGVGAGVMGLVACGSGSSGGARWILPSHVPPLLRFCKRSSLGLCPGRSDCLVFFVFTGKSVIF